MAINWTVNHVALRRESAGAGVRLTFRGCTAERRILWRFSLPAVLGGMLAGPVLWAAYGLTQIITLLPGLVSRVSLPILCELHGGAERRRYRNMLGRLAGMYAVFCLAVVIPLCVFSPQLMSVYGRGFRGGWTTLCVLSIALSFSTISSVIGQGIVPAGRLWWGFLLNALWAGEMLAAAIEHITGTYWRRLLGSR